MTQDTSNVTTTPAMWAQDPWQQHQLRYWDGTRWTEHVANGGTTALDPVPATPPIGDLVPRLRGSGPGPHWAPAAPARLSFASAVARCFRNYANFKGRAARPEFWWFLVFYAVVVTGFFMLELELTGTLAWSALPWLVLAIPCHAGGG